MKFKAKPKFRLGQVVCVQRQYQSGGHYFRITGINRRHNEPGWEYALQPGGNAAVEFALRPLTPKERGPQ